LGVSVYDSYNFGTVTPWSSYGGTSAGTPQWAALIAIVNQGRAQLGMPTLDGPSQTLPAIYSVPGSDFNDVTSGSNTGNSAGPGYDMVTGLGTPKANRLVPDLVYSTSPQEDTFFIGNNGALYTAWESNNAAWHAPLQISASGLAPAGAQVTVVTRNIHQEDVFFVGNNGALYTAWESNGGAWHAPLQISASGLAPAGARVTALGRSPAQEDVFFVGSNGALYTAWESNNGAWHGPAQIGASGLAPAGSRVTAAARSYSQEDLFVVGNSGALYTVWEYNNGAWHAPLQISVAGLAPSGANIAAIKRGSSVI
jgi:hypothetical protein